MGESSSLWANLLWASLLVGEFTVIRCMYTTNISLFLDSNTMASIVSPIAQPSRPKSVSRPKRWSEEVEEGTVE